ncbi:TetR/AcrR family transcriptional regulator [Blastococcus sp. SYSU D00695]
MSAAERRQQLIRAAIDVMMRDGVAAASTRAIASELGIAQAMVHYVYGSKDELYRAVIEQLTTEVTDHVRDGDLPPGVSFRSAVEMLAERLWDSVLTRPEIYQLLTELVILGLRSRSLHPTITEYQRELDDAFTHWLRRAASRAGTVPARPIADVSRVFAAGLDGLILQRLARQDDEADLRALADLVEATAALAEGRLVPSACSPTAGALGTRTA